MLKLRAGFLVLLIAALSAAARPANAGSIALSWDATQGARALNGLLGEEPCAISNDRLIFVRTQGYESGLWRCDRRNCF